MKLRSKILKLKTKKNFQFIDITDKVGEFVKKEDLKEGQILIFSRHTTLAVRVNEKENCFFDDFNKFFNEFIPKDKYYRHNDLKVRTENLVCSDGTRECLNGHAHCQHLFLGTSETVPVSNGKISLGKWQRILAIELDGPKQREIYLQLLGE
ncbi:MAG: hypothetical protein GTN40_03490 [Candidatus Aenigmarchaeota archaeon]|nr:hypothetical protein [Candidatus Aenigmarchaeota archaeon]